MKILPIIIGPENSDFKMQIIGDQANSKIFQQFLSSTIEREKGKLVELIEFN